MASYKEIRAQIRKLEAEAEIQRCRELKALIADIKSKIAIRKLTAADLGFDLKGKGKLKSGKGAKAKKPTNKGKSLQVKYRGPDTGATWAGVGRPPTWPVAAQTAGTRRESFAVE